MMKINKYNIAVIGGAGHIGLPLSLVLAEKNHTVKIIDIDVSNFKKIKKGIFPFTEKGGNNLLKKIIKKKNLILSNKSQIIKNCEFIFLTIGTPIDNHSNPNINTVLKTVNSFKKYLKKNSILILRSTLFPGTSILIKDLLKSSKIKCEVAFCPERIAQGDSIKEIYDLPQIISTDNIKTRKKVNELFNSINKNCINVSFEEAELAKLYSNAWRNIKFSIANQFYMHSTEKKINFNNIRKAMIKDYPRNKDFPSPGFTAGPCLIKDTLQASAFNINHSSLFLESVNINESMPLFLVNQLEKEISIKGKKIGILGMTFKKNIDDIRDSLSYKLKKILEAKGAKVLCSDPYYKDKDFFSEKEVISQCKIIFIGSYHTSYKKLKFNNNKIITF